VESGCQIFVSGLPYLSGGGNSIPRPTHSRPRLFFAVSYRLRIFGTRHAGYVRWRTHYNLGNFMGYWDHVPLSLIKDFAYGITLLDARHLHHCLSCEECSKAWLTFKRDAGALRRAKDLAARTAGEIGRLVNENNNSKTDWNKKRSA